MSCLKTNIDTKRGYHRDRATGIVVSECGAISTKFWCITGVVFPSLQILHVHECAQIPGVYF